VVLVRRLAIFGVWVLAAHAVFEPSPARASDNAPVIVIPSRPGVPVVINGVDASYAVVEGDWGLARPGHGVITVFGGRPLYPNHVYRERNAYHPFYGRAPARGRNEIEPPADRALPPQAESFSRSWSTSSDPLPAVESPAPQAWPSQSQDIDAAPTKVNDRRALEPPIRRHRQKRNHDHPRGHRGQASKTDAVR
jgi:hypothetical protein